MHSTEQTIALLRLCGLKVPENVDYTVGIYDGDPSQLVAVGSLKGDMIQGLAVSPDHQGEDLSARILTHLIQVAFETGRRTLYLFTKPSGAEKFSAMGFRLVTEAKPYAALLEWGISGIKEYVGQLQSISRLDPGEASVVIVNCNPFTLGHQYLIETASRKSRKVYVIVVEEDQSVFPFGDRIELVRQGTAHLANVVVLPGGRYVVSSLTFPSYFTRDVEVAAAHCAMDVELFLKYLVPALGITRRFIGTEPFSEVTEIYNQTMRERLIPAGITVEVIERKIAGTQPISASSVRRLLAEGKLEELRALVPETTYAYLISPGAIPVINKLRHKDEKHRGYIEDQQS
jgi:[citrate (pro-3S)-lyase] ligase